MMELIGRYSNKNRTTEELLDELHALRELGWVLGRFASINDQSPGARGDTH